MKETRTLYGLRVFSDRRVQLITAIVVLLVVAFIRLNQIVYSAQSHEIGYDFSAYWQAARNALERVPLYADFQLAGPYSAQQQFLYLYPPFLAVLVIPLAVLFSTYVGAAWAWTFLSLALFCASIVGVARTEKCSWPLTVALLALGLALAPVALEMYIGNVHILLLAFLSFGWIALRRNTNAGDVGAGLAIAAATLVKLFPAVLIVWLFITGRRRATWFSIAAVIVLALVTVPIVGVDDWLDYPQVAANIAAPTDASNVLAPTAWLAPILGFTVARVLVTVIGITLLVWSAMRQEASLSYAVAVLVSLLIVPALYLHYLALVALPLLLLFVSGKRGRALSAIAYVIVFVTTQALIGRAEDDMLRGLATIGLVVTLLLILVAGRGAQPQDEVETLRPLSA